MSKCTQKFSLERFLFETSVECVCIRQLLGCGCRRSHLRRRHRSENENECGWFAYFDFHSEFDGGETRAFRFSAIAAQQIIIKILVMVVAVV